MSFFTANLGTAQAFRISSQSRSYEASDPEDAEFIYNIRGVGVNKGKVQYAGYNVGDAASYSTAYSWAIPNAGWTGVHIRLTYDGASDTVQASSHAIDGTTWHALTEDSNNIFWTTRHTGILGDTTTIIDVELSLDGGSTVVASGTFTAQCTVAV